MRYEPLRDIEQKVSLRLYENAKADFHFHKSVEIIFVQKGKLRVWSGISDEFIGEGEAAFIPAYYSHAVKCLQPSSSYTLIIPDGYYKNVLDSGKKLDYFHLGDKQANKAIFRYIKALDESIKNYDKLIAQGYVNIILGLICNGYKTQQSNGQDSRLMGDIIKYIDENFKSNITLSGISQVFGYSKYHFSKLFNRYFGCNLNFFVNTVRYNYVEERKLSGVKLADLAYEAGFNEMSTYYRFCKARQKL